MDQWHKLHANKVLERKYRSEDSFENDRRGIMDELRPNYTRIYLWNAIHLTELSEIWDISQHGHVQEHFTCFPYVYCFILCLLLYSIVFLC
jgi:hypothetical protein